MTNRLLEINNLKVHFPIRSGMLKRVSGYVKAVDGVSFHINEGETLGLVGESGSGKTTVGRSILRAIDPTEGDILFYPNGQDYNLSTLSHKMLRKIRPTMQMIFQDPYSSLSPRMTIRDIIAEPLVATNGVAGEKMSRQEIDDRVREISEHCKINLEYLRRFPHAFSGGQRQRIGIARALAPKPKLIICDESVSALDVSIQAEILNLLMDLQDEFGLTYLFIAHDLSVVAHIADRVAVMYLGQLVELAPTKHLFYSPKHPYTEALMSAIPEVDPRKPMQPLLLEGEIPNPANPPSGCRFHTRCRYVQDRCKQEEPEWREYEPEHFVKCHFTEELTLKGIAIETENIETNRKN